MLVLFLCAALLTPQSTFSSASNSISVSVSVCVSHLRVQGKCDLRIRSGYLEGSTHGLVGIYDRCRELEANLFKFALRWLIIGRELAGNQTQTQRCIRPGANEVSISQSQPPDAEQESTEWKGVKQVERLPKVFNGWEMGGLIVDAVIRGRIDDGNMEF